MLPTLWSNSHIESTAEREAREMAEMPKFKARALNKKILESAGELGVPKVHKKPLTEPKQFNFKSDERIKRHHATHDEGTAAATAHTKTARKRTAYTGQPTVPVSPHLSYKTSRRQQQLAVQETDKALHKNAKFSSGPVELTQPKPFVLQSDIRGAQKNAAFEANLQRLQVCATVACISDGATAAAHWRQHPFSEEPTRMRSLHTSQVSILAH
eukprot:COSAG01_NODE_24873_length_763_cov_1.216867_1_plen_212_part_10